MWNTYFFSLLETLFLSVVGNETFCFTARLSFKRYYTLKQNRLTFGHQKRGEGVKKCVTYILDGPLHKKPLNMITLGQTKSDCIETFEIWKHSATDNSNQWLNKAAFTVIFMSPHQPNCQFLVCHHEGSCCHLLLCLKAFNSCFGSCWWRNSTCQKLPLLLKALDKSRKQVTTAYNKHSQT